jgi:hypothetical protein
MGDLISHVIDAPIPNLRVISGLAFLAIAVLGNISGRIEPGKAGRIAAAVLGSALLVYGVVQHSHSDSESRQDRQDHNVTAPPPAEGRVFTPMQVDTDLFGGDYQGFDVSNADACERECKKDPRCKAWSYVRPGVQGPQARCYLKDRIPSPTPNTCCISGSVK